MSEPKLNIKEETSTQKTRSPPKKAKVEQSVPKKKKLTTVRSTILRKPSRTIAMYTPMDRVQQLITNENTTRGGQLSSAKCHAG